LRLLPNIRFGTEQYPPKVARRLRALNITTWSAAVLGSIFAVTQLLDPTPGAWKVALTNVIGSLALAMIPMLHRVGPRAVPAGFAIIIYTYIFVVCWQIGVGTGMQIQYLAVAAVTILFLGTERIFLISAFAVAAVVLIIICDDGILQLHFWRVGDLRDPVHGGFLCRVRSRARRSSRGTRTRALRRPAREHSARHDRRPAQERNRIGHR
jgi:hypothetical protein